MVTSRDIEKQLRRDIFSTKERLRGRQGRCRRRPRPQRLQAKRLSRQARRIYRGRRAPQVRQVLQLLQAVWPAEAAIRRFRREGVQDHSSAHSSRAAVDVSLGAVQPAVGKHRKQLKGGASGKIQPVLQALRWALLRSYNTTQDTGHGRRTGVRFRATAISMKLTSRIGLAGSPERSRSIPSKGVHQLHRGQRAGVIVDGLITGGTTSLGASTGPPKLSIISPKMQVSIVAAIADLKRSGRERSELVGLSV